MLEKAQIADMAKSQSELETEASVFFQNLQSVELLSGIEECAARSSNSLAIELPKSAETTLSYQKFIAWARTQELHAFLGELRNGQEILIVMPSP